MTTMAALIYSYSPVHTDEYYARKAREIADAGAERVFIKDVDGLLTPGRVRTLVPAVMREIDGLPLELHGHCSTGLAPVYYMDALELGVHTLHTAVAPLGQRPLATVGGLHPAQRQVAGLPDGHRRKGTGGNDGALSLRGEAGGLS